MALKDLFRRNKPAPQEAAEMPVAVEPDAPSVMTGTEMRAALEAGETLEFDLDAPPPCEAEATPAEGKPPVREVKPPKRETKAPAAETDGKRARFDWKPWEATMREFYPTKGAAWIVEHIRVHGAGEVTEANVRQHAFGMGLKMDRAVVKQHLSVAHKGGRKPKAVKPLEVIQEALSAPPGAMKAEVEAACDEMVVAETGHEPRPGMLCDPINGTTEKQRRKTTAIPSPVEKTAADRIRESGNGGEWRPTDDQALRVSLGYLADRLAETTGLPKRKVLGKIAAACVEEA